MACSRSIVLDRIACTNSLLPLVGVGASSIAEEHRTVINPPAKHRQAVVMSESSVPGLLLTSHMLLSPCTKT